MAEEESADPENLISRNCELIKTIQHWKMMAAQKENEKLELIKENNQLRLELSRLRNAEAANVRKLHYEMHSRSQEALDYLVKASTIVSNMLELPKTYLQDRKKAESRLPRWSNLSNTPATEKVNRVRPLLMGGKDIQPMVCLDRTLHTNNSISSRSPNQQNRSITARALPLHMLQDVFIPLTRIDAEVPVNNIEVNVEQNETDNSSEDFPSDDNDEDGFEEAQENLEESAGLDTVPEEPESAHNTPQRSRTENPLEGPSWLLDSPSFSTERNSRNLKNLEPDSTTELQENEPTPESSATVHLQVPPVAAPCEFTPTVRRNRRKRTSVAPAPATPKSFSPRPRRNSKILKVVISKMRLDYDEDASSPKRARPAEPPARATPAEPQARPQKISQRRSPETPRRSADAASGSPILGAARDRTHKKLMRFDAPSPNGSTDARVIVLETVNSQPQMCSSGEPRSRTRSRTHSRENHKPNSNHNHAEHSSSNHDNHRTNSRENHVTQNSHIQPNHSNSYQRTNVNDNHTSQNNHSSDNHRTNSHENHIQPNHGHDNHRTNSNDNQISQNNHMQRNHSHDNHNHGNLDNQTSDMSNIKTNTMQPNHSHDNHNHGNLDNHASDMSNIKTDTGSRDSRRRRRVNSQNDYASSNGDSASRGNSCNHNGVDSDSSNSDALNEGRTRRPRKPVVYKEKPLNRKLRR